MALKKSTRTGSRYISFTLISGCEMNVERELRHFLVRMHGLLNVPKFKLFERGGNTFTLKCSREGFGRTRASLALFYSDSFRIRLIGSSGTLKHK